MATVRVKNPEWSADTQISCGTAIEHLNSRDYERAAALLREAKVVCNHNGDQLAAHVLNAAHRICLACKGSQEEAEWHGRAYAEVLEREQALREELQTILDLMRDPGLSDSSQVGERAPSDRSTRTNERDPCVPIPVGPHGLWNRIQNLLQASSGQRNESAKVIPAATATASDESVSTRREAPPSLAVCCLGPFQVYLNDRLVENWRNGKGKSVFKYLATHHDRPVSKEILMGLFWPDASPSHARNSLNVTVYHIRQTLAGPRPFSHILFQDDCYLLNPELEIWIDSESFSEHVALARAMEGHGSQKSAIQEYCAADALYGGRFLEEDRYEEWIVPLRQSLEDDYLKLLDRLIHHYFELQEYDRCVSVCNKILAVDSCQEQAHRQIMRCYSRQMQPNLAMRQYHNCVEALERELGVVPSALTVELDQRIRNCELV